MKNTYLVIVGDEIVLSTPDYAKALLEYNKHPHENDRPSKLASIFQQVKP
jgi:hypothetical protein